MIKFCIAAWEQGSWGYMRCKNYVVSHCIIVNYIIWNVFNHKHHHFRYFILTWLMDGTICWRSDRPTGPKRWPADGHNPFLNCLIPPYNWNSIIHILLIKSLNNYIPTNVSISLISMRMGVVTQNSLLVSPRWGILLQKRTRCRVTSTEKPHINFRSVLIDIHRIFTAIF